MGLFRKLISTALDVVTVPLDVVRDTSDVLQGYNPRNTTEKIKRLAEDASEIVSDAVDLDL